MRFALALQLTLSFLAQVSPDAGTPPPLIPRGAASEADLVLARARTFFSNLLGQKARELVAQAEFPFYLEGRKINSADELLQDWERNLGGKRTDLLTLYGIEILTPGEMEKKYGQPPARLATLPWKSPKTYVAVANISGHAAVAVFHRSAKGWRVVGYTD